MTEMWKKNRWISLLTAAVLLFTGAASFAETQNADLPIQQERAEEAAEDAGAEASPSIFENEEREDSLTDTVTAWAEAIYKTLSEEERQ